MSLGRYDEAGTALREAEALAREQSNALALIGDLGPSLSSTRRWGIRAVWSTTLRQTTEIGLGRGQLGEMAGTWLAGASMCLTIGELDQAERLIEPAKRVLAQSGDRYQLLTAAHLEATIVASRGDIARARELFAEVLGGAASSPTTPSRSARSWTLRTLTICSATTPARSSRLGRHIGGPSAAGCSAAVGVPAERGSVRAPAR